MMRTFTASVWQEGEWYVAQALEVDVASQGESEETALENLREALELHFEPPTATVLPEVHTIEVEVGAA
ncbi:MAG: type II toxin-antitoxin system HicB family antitoxin [Chloroflexi bacterium]|nr:type II toxin-antitoxin system HicB family antitoxin [Chloroflexota bacterium]